MTEMSANFKTKLENLLQLLSSSHVKISNLENLKRKVEAFHQGGVSKLQLITDYDLTLTKHHVNGVLTHSSFGLFSLCPSLPEDFKKQNIELKDKYYPIEMNTKMPLNEKIRYMEEWYAESERLFSDIPYNEEELKEIVKNNLPELRNGSVELLKTLEGKQVPTLILSAGLGATIQAVLAAHGVQESDYLHVISNFFKHDGTKVTGYGCLETGQFLHPFNKNGHGCADYFKKHPGKSNVVLMGDSIGDASMDNGVPQLENVLKIGFLYGTEEHINDNLSNFLGHFDVVLIDDQTMKIPAAIFDTILSAHN